ncbi:cytochrome C oxidase subunit II [Granulicella sibirica]|nr:cytochrome C oxidase subunit II [Granulicella sibirica]
MAMVRMPWGLPRDASAHGVALDQHLILNLWIAFSLAVLAHMILLIGILLRRPAAEASERRRLLIEYLPLAALTLLFGFLAMRAERLWEETRYTGASPAALQVEATGMQFAWYFRYPGVDGTFGRTSAERVDPGAANPVGVDPADPHGADDMVSSELVLPEGREVDLRLIAQDVIHGFAVPEMRLKQNAVPGQTIHVHFTPTDAGTYAILCTQLCGLGHYRMQANLRVLTEAGYQDWLRKRQR